MQMELINNPAFWEVLGAVLVLILVSPLIYMIYAAARMGYDAWKAGTWRNKTEARMVDPTFGVLQLFRDSGWEGEVLFSPTQQPVGILVGGTVAGPTDEQRTLYQRIEQRYEDLLPDIHRSLVQHVEQDWEFALCGIEIPADQGPDKWTGQYVANTEDDGDMGYFVDVVDWKVVAVTGVD
jgi:hypothetical protein